MNEKFLTQKGKYITPDSLNPTLVLVELLIEKGIIEPGELIEKRNRMAEERNEQLKKHAEKDPLLQSMMKFSDMMCDMLCDMNENKPIEEEEMQSIIDFMKQLKKISK